MKVYVGTYTEAQNGQGEGIYAFDFDEEAGTLTPTGVTPGLVNPSWLTANADHTALYATSEGDPGEVVAFRIDPKSGALAELNRVSSEGISPCHLALTADGRYLLVANYASGSFAALPIVERGSLQAASDSIQRHGVSVDPSRQEGPHAHMIAPSPDGRYVLVTDLGTDEITAYQFDRKSGLFGRSDETHTATSLTAGAGPRHFAFSPDGETVYVINELDSTLAVFHFDGATGAMRPLQTISTVPDDFSEQNYPAQVLVAADGRFVYGSNRLHDSIVIWRVEETDGTVKTVGHVSTQGAFPRNFAFDPSEKWLIVANQNSDSLVTFARDAETGELSPHGSPVAVPSPVAVLFV